MSKKLDKIIKDANTPLEEMTDFQLARWTALVEGVNIIADKADDRGMVFKKMSIKQPALRNYIEGTCDIIARTIKEEKRQNAAKEIARSTQGNNYGG